MTYAVCFSKQYFRFNDILQTQQEIRCLFCHHSRGASSCCKSNKMKHKDCPSLHNLQKSSVLFFIDRWSTDFDIDIGTDQLIKHCLFVEKPK